MKNKKFLLTLIVIIGLITTVSCQKNDTTSGTTSNTSETTVTTNVTTTISTTDTETTTTETTTEVTTETTTTTTFEDESRIEVTTVSNLSYMMYDEFDTDDITVVYYDSEGVSETLSYRDYSLSDFDMNSAGTKQVSVTYGDYSAEFYFEVIDYYLSASSLTGSNLFDVLRTIVNEDFQGVTYGDSRYILDETDQDPDNSSNVILVYEGTSVSGVWDTNSLPWNREHVWPQSALPGSASNGTANTCSDLHNLKPADPAENNYRSSKYFDDYMSSSTYEPRDEVKGDIARIMLYMVVMYDELTLVDGTPNTNNYEMGKLSTLLDWHESDPVDEFEMNRNDVIFSYQYNRNPFIDHPEYVDLIWG